MSIEARVFLACALFWLALGWWGYQTVYRPAAAERARVAASWTPREVACNALQREDLRRGGGWMTPADEAYCGGR